MQKLKAANLYNSDLIQVSGKLVDRYNEALETLGFKATQLKVFSIDAMGWSPEVAEEKQDDNYLNHGDANPHGIIISPLQKNKPVYVPFHTFDRDIIKLIFKTHANQINDITRNHAICINFDQGVDAFYDPIDVLKYDNIKISFRITGDLDQVQKEQQALIDKFNLDYNFIDETLHEQLLNSANTYGDLRGRNFNLTPIHYKTDSFYTRAFKGIYVLKDFVTPILIFEDEVWYKAAIKDTDHDVLMYHVSQPELIDKLKNYNIIEIDLDEVVMTERYQRIKKFVLSQLLTNVEHPLDQVLEDKILFRRYLNTLDIELLKKVNGVEIYLERFQKNKAIQVETYVERKFLSALYQPHSSLTIYEKDLIWQLIVNISSFDVLFLYWYDKTTFYKNYSNWSEGLKDWVIHTIKQNI